MKAIIIFLLFAIQNIFAQPKLQLKPNKIEFKDLFDRLENVYFINAGDSDLIIDTIKYNKDFYFVRFDKVWKFPLRIQAGDSLKMDCLLAGYFNVTSNDTLDTMKVVYSQYSEEEDLSIKIKYYNDEDNRGFVKGTVTDSSGVISNAKLYFYRDGNYLIRTTYSDVDGKYFIKLPEGNYTIAANKKDYYFTFFDQQYDPYRAKQIFIKRDSVVQVNFDLLKTVKTANKISGQLNDLGIGTPVNRGIVVVRKGKHTPTKLTARAASLSQKIQTYTATVNEGGTFSIDNIIQPGYYYIQAFSDFYLPSYPANSNESIFFWQQTDSVYIQNSVENINFLLKRDSSYGAGIITGAISVNGSTSNDSVNISDVILFAENVELNELTYYTIPKQDGTFKIDHLPYGKYKLIAQSIGFADAVSSSYYNISPSSTEIKNADLHFTLTSIKYTSNNIPNNLKLYQNYPNPFNPTTTIQYTVPVAVKTLRATSQLVQLKVYDLLGKKVATLVNEIKQPGNYKVSFNANSLSSGIYYYSLKTPYGIITKKMEVLK